MARKTKQPKLPRPAKPRSTKGARIGRRIVGVGITAGLAVGAYANWEDIDNALFTPDPATLDHISDQALVEKSVKDSLDFWKKQKIGKAASTKLVIVQGGPEYDYHCKEADGTEKVTQSYSNELGYCAITNTVTIGAKPINELRYYNKSEEDGNVAIKGWIRSATAGVVQAERPDLLENAPTDSDEKAAFATHQLACIAGIETAVTPTGIADTNTIFESYMHSTDPEHGDHRTFAFSYKRGFDEEYKLIPVNSTTPPVVNVDICAELPASK